MFPVRYELCFLYSVVTELMLRDMPRYCGSDGQLSVAGCSMAIIFSLGEGGGGSNEVCQMWSGCGGSLQFTTSCSEEPQRNMWLLN